MWKTAYRGRYLRVEQKSFTIRSKKIKFERSITPAVVVVIPFLNDNTLILESNRRWVIGKNLLELPAGDIEVGEKPSSAAKRELEEETGYRASHLRFLFKAYFSPGISTEVGYFFMAKNLTSQKARLNKSEKIQLKRISITKTLKMVKENRIRDNKTIAGILYCAIFLKMNR